MAQQSFTKIVCFSSLADSYPPEKIKSIREKLKCSRVLT